MSQKTCFFILITTKVFKPLHVYVPGITEHLITLKWEGTESWDLHLSTQPMTWQCAVRILKKGCSWWLLKAIWQTQISIGNFWIHLHSLMSFASNQVLIALHLFTYLSYHTVFASKSILEQSGPYCRSRGCRLESCKPGLKQVNKKSLKWVWPHLHKWQTFWWTCLIICFLLTHIFAPEVMHHIFSSICILNLVVELRSNRNALPCMLAVVVWANHFLFGLNMIIFSWCKWCEGKHPAASLARLLAV